MVINNFQTYRVLRFVMKHEDFDLEKLRKKFTYEDVLFLERKSLIKKKTISFPKYRDVVLITIEGRNAEEEYRFYLIKFIFDLLSIVISLSALAVSIIALIQGLGL